MGADVLRLWVSATDYSGELSVSDEILNRTSDAYRRIRNTLRYLLSNLDGFDPSTDKASSKEMIAIDYWIVWKTNQLQKEISNLQCPPLPRSTEDSSADQIYNPGSGSIFTIHKIHDK